MAARSPAALPGTAGARAHAVLRIENHLVLRSAFRPPDTALCVGFLGLLAGPDAPRHTHSPRDGADLCRCRPLAVREWHDARSGAAIFTAPHGGIGRCYGHHR